MPAIVWICVIAASWLGNVRAAQQRAEHAVAHCRRCLVLACDTADGKHPVTLLATLPLLFMSGAFERRDTPLRTRSIALTLVALGTLAISILGYVLLNGASAGPLDEGILSAASLATPPRSRLSTSCRCSSCWPFMHQGP